MNISLLTKEGESIRIRILPDWVTMESVTMDKDGNVLSIKYRSPDDVAMLVRQFPELKEYIKSMTTAPIRLPE